MASEYDIVGDPEMPIYHSVWRVGQPPTRLQEATLSEQLLEDMIVAAPEILSDQWMVIGRQEITGLGGRIDLLAIAPDASLILINSSGVAPRVRWSRKPLTMRHGFNRWVPTT